MLMHANLQLVTDAKGRRRRATYDDVLNAPEHMVAEIIDGELYLWPRPAPPHAVASYSLGAELLPPFQQGRGGPGGWWIIGEPELHLKKDVLVPDIAGWRRERMPLVPDTAWFDVVPDWVCEVLSPSTANTDRSKKLPIYARERIPYAWFVDPIEQTLDVMIRSGRHWPVKAAYTGKDRVRAEPFDAIEIDLALVWGGISDAGSAEH
jgi:Uma2 family endonuclease